MRAVLTFQWADHLARYAPNTESSNSGERELALWLADDASSIDAAEYWHSRLQKVANGKLPEGYLGTGNAHSLMAIGTRVFIMCEYDDTMKVLLTFNQISSLLAQYISLQDKGISEVRHSPQAIDVEYEASGDEALASYKAMGGSLSHSE